MNRTKSLKKVAGVRVVRTRDRQHWLNSTTMVLTDLPLGTIKSTGIGMCNDRCCVVDWDNGTQTMLANVDLRTVNWTEPCATVGCEKPATVTRPGQGDGGMGRPDAQRLCTECDRAHGG